MINIWGLIVFEQCDCVLPYTYLFPSFTVALHNIRVLSPTNLLWRDRPLVFKSLSTLHVNQKRFAVRLSKATRQSIACGIDAVYTMYHKPAHFLSTIHVSTVWNAPVCVNCINTTTQTLSACFWQPTCSIPKFGLEKQLRVYVYMNYTVAQVHL